MKAAVLSTPPTSGTLRERWFDAIGECTWIQFEDEQGERWAGAFGNSRLIKDSSVICSGMGTRRSSPRVAKDT
jgi:hypothetical protein